MIIIKTINIFVTHPAKFEINLSPLEEERIHNQIFNIRYMVIPVIHALIKNKIGSIRHIYVIVYIMIKSFMLF